MGQGGAWNEYCHRIFFKNIYRWADLEGDERRIINISPRPILILGLTQWMGIEPRAKIPENKVNVKFLILIFFLLLRVNRAEASGKAECRGY